MTLRSLVAIGIVLSPKVASATWSIVAVDRSTGQLGAAGASCVGARSIQRIYGGVPGRGALVAQALLNDAARDRGVMLLMNGSTAAEVIAAITDPTFDRDFARRQFGVVTLDGMSAGFTGARTSSYAADRQSVIGSFVHSVQGNLLTGPEVLDRAGAAFAGGGCDLAARLFAGLVAGGQNGAGDARCTPNGIPADSAFLVVEDARGADLIRIEALSRSATEDPLIALRAAYDLWRQDHACPVADAGFAEDARAPDAVPRDAEPRDAEPRADAGSPVIEPTSKEGCSCRAGHDGHTAGGLVLLAAFPMARRRSCRLRIRR
jgi:uncharacterized Ntn-hydrolase superfamily protein